MLCRMRAALSLPPKCSTPPCACLCQSSKEQKNQAQSRHFKYLMAQHYLAIDGRHRGGAEREAHKQTNYVYRRGPGEWHNDRGPLLSISCGQERKRLYCCYSCQALRNSSIKAFSMHFPDISAAYGGKKLNREK